MINILKHKKIIFLFFLIILLFVVFNFINQNKRNTEIKEFNKEYFYLYYKESKHFYQNFFLYKRFIYFFNECYFKSKNNLRDEILRDKCIDNVINILSNYHEEPLINELITNFYSFTTIFNQEAKKIKDQYNIKQHELPFKI
tara:strand:- start:2520 stop:2945 length:426 start_codon:yes stop_codon:yes gene_type:complete